MATLTEAVLERLLAPYLSGDTMGFVEGRNVPDAVRLQAVDHERLYIQLSQYLDLLLKWNERTNLTAIRSPEEIVERHFGESLFAARCIGAVLQEASLLDFGSGAGFPGIPLQLFLPRYAVTLSESQGKKAAFLRTVVRELGLPTEVWGGRVSGLAPERSFDVVATRAVDDPERAHEEAWSRVRTGGWLLEMTTSSSRRLGAGAVSIALPGSRDGVVLISRKA